MNKLKLVVRSSYEFGQLPWTELLRDYSMRLVLREGEGTVWCVCNQCIRDMTMTVSNYPITLVFNKPITAHKFMELETLLTAVRHE